MPTIGTNASPRWRLRTEPGGECARCWCCGSSVPRTALLSRQSPDAIPVCGKRTCRWAPCTEVRVMLGSRHTSLLHWASVGRHTRQVVHQQPHGPCQCSEAARPDQLHAMHSHGTTITSPSCRCVTVQSRRRAVGWQAASPWIHCRWLTRRCCGRTSNFLAFRQAPTGGEHRKRWSSDQCLRPTYQRPFVRRSAPGTPVYARQDGLADKCYRDAPAQELRDEFIHNDPTRARRSFMTKIRIGQATASLK